MRSGNAAMMARRSPSLIVAHRAISSMVRPQPMHSAVSAASRQTLTQGVSKEVPAEYPADYVGIGATGSQKPDIRGRLQGVSAQPQGPACSTDFNSSLEAEQNKRGQSHGDVGAARAEQPRTA